VKTYCNPINIQYKYQHFKNHASREAADPTLVLFKGKYYLFASMSAGFYYSDDLVNWNYHENYNLELYRYAPDVRQVGEYLYFCASDYGKNCTFFRSKDPLSDDFEPFSSPFPFWDPDIFTDDDGHVYFFWGCSNDKPIYGVEMDPKTMRPVGKKQAVIAAKPYEHGFERAIYPGRKKVARTFFMKIVMGLVNFGKDKNMPFFEGAFVSKFNGKYYLQYAAPATTESVYADGVYVADKPLGPYTFQEHNPFSSRVRGFITGAGHGSTIADKHGNLWHASTMSICVNDRYERRVGLFPAGIDCDGYLFCNQNFADYPLRIPEGKFDPLRISPKWMLLSYKKEAAASSSMPGHPPCLALNEDIRSWWCAQGGKGQWYKLDLQGDYDVNAIQINFADNETPAFDVPASKRSGIATGHRYIAPNERLYTRYLLEGGIDGETWITLVDKSQAETDLSHDYLVFDSPPHVRFLRITVNELPYPQNFALSGFRVFGKGKDKKPSIVGKASAAFPDEMTVRLEWEKASGAIGYNIRLGIAPDKLYTSYQVYEETNVLITTLNKGQGYCICIDSFNENGVTNGETVTLRSNV
jgi:hypothetical protein